MLCVCAALAIFYGVFVSLSISNTVARENTQVRIIELQETLGTLEFTYLSGRDRVSETYALTIGFVPLTKKTYVARAPRDSVVTLNR